MKILLVHTALIAFVFSGMQTKEKLTINFKGFKNNDGKVLVLIINEKEEKVASFKSEIKNLKVTKTIELPKGKYAISCFHDENSDEKLNTNFMGIPKEIYGFSNNARGMFGPPSLKEQLFSLENSTTQEIILK